MGGRSCVGKPSAEIRINLCVQSSRYTLFPSEVGAISSQSVGVGSNGSYGQSDVQALSLVASPVRMSI